MMALFEKRGRERKREKAGWEKNNGIARRALGIEGEM